MPAMNVVRLVSCVAPLVLVLAGPAAGQTLPLSRADVDADCRVTSADVAIVRGALSRRCGQTGFVASADVNQDCRIDNTDLTFVVRNLGRTVCTEPPPAPTIVASVTPAPNGAGWHRDDVTVSFTCTNVTACPAPVVVTTEGVGQVIERTAAGPGGTVSARVTVNLDKTPPRVAAQPPPSALPGQRLEIAVDATDANGVVRASLYSGTQLVDESLARPFVLARTVPQNAPIGTADSLDVYVEDPAGNAGSLRTSITIDVPDTVPPDVRLIVPPTVPPGAQVPVTVAASDDRGVARVRVTRLDNGTNVPLDERTGEPFAFQTVASIRDDASDGDVITFAVLATDTSGNDATTTATATVATSVPTEALRVTVNPPVSPTFQSAAVVSGTIGRAATAAPPAAPPILAGVSPSTGRQGQTVDLTLAGINTAFSASSQVTLGPGITVQAVTATSPTSLVVRVTIDAGAGLGPRLVAVQSGQQEALLGSGFLVQPGLATVTGRLLDADRQPLAGARVCLPDGSRCTVTDAQGRFTFADVPADVTRVIASAEGHESSTLRLKLGTGDTAGVGDVALAVSTAPPPPPLPTAPPVTPQLAVALGRGAAELFNGGNPAALEKLARDTILAVGGDEIGVLDAEGRQLNPRIAGPGLLSFSQTAVEELARELIAGDTISLAEMLKIVMGSLEFPAGVAKPSLLQLLAALQQAVDDVWADPSRPEAPLVIVLFNQGRVMSPTPPQVRFDTTFNALQRDLLVSSFLTFVSTTLGTDRQAALGGPVLPLAGRLAGAAPAYRPPPSSALAGFGGHWRPSALRDGLALPPRLQLLPGDKPASNKWSPASVTWSIVLEKSLPQTGWQAAQKGAGLCDKFLVKVASLPAPLPGDSPAGQQAATDPLAKFLPAPQCKDALTLAEMLLSTKPDYGRIGRQFTSFLTSERVTRANAQRVYGTLEHATFQKAFAEARAEALKQSRTLEQVRKFANFGAGLVQSSLTKYQGTAINAIFGLEVALIVESLRPRAPFIRDVTQVPDATTNPPSPSRLVKIRFDRSPNDNGNVDSVVWKYYLLRGRSGEETPIAMKVFGPGAETVFYDEVPEDGTFYYRVRAMRQVGSAVIPSHQQNGLDEIYGFLAGIVPSAGSKTPAGHQMLSIDFVKTVTDPLASIYRGLHVQTSDASEPEAINVTLQSVTRPPANLVVDPHLRVAYLSVPATGYIYRIQREFTSLFAAHGFAAPGAAGLAIDSRGYLYTDNAASDARFGGRIFNFRRDDGLRMHVGNTNYLSLLLQNANPVSVQSLLVAPSPRGEALYIADAYTQRLTLLTLPWRWAPGVTAPRNTSQPYVTSPLFNFSGSTTMAMRPDDTLAITQYDNVLLVEPGGTRVSSLFRAGENPFRDLTGVTFDRYGHMYLSDANLGAIMQVPYARQSPGFGYFGLDAAEQRLFTVLRGARRPSDVKLGPDGDGLVFFDGERAFARVGFGLAGRITVPGGAPLAGATVLLPQVNRVARTDGDGIFIVSDLLTYDGETVFDLVVRADGATQSFVVALQPSTHNIRRFVFDPPAPPPTPPPGTVPPPPPPPPGDRTVVVPSPTVVTEDTVSVVFDVQRTGDPPPAADAESCVRAVFLTPGNGVGVASATPMVRGWFTEPGVEAPVLLVNGVPQPLVAAGQDFTVTPALLVGDNTLAVAVRAAWLRDAGCLADALPDEQLVPISVTHRVFHDPDPAALAAYRAGSGSDLSIRVLIRDNGRPLAGLSLHVPGTGLLAWTDGEGMVQLDIPKAGMAARASAVDALSTSLYQRIGQIVAHLRADRRADAIAAIEGLLAQAAVTVGSPPTAGASLDTVLGLILQIEGTAARLLEALQSPAGIPEEADIDALEALGQGMAGADSNGEIVVRSREYADVTLKVRVQ